MRSESTQKLSLFALTGMVVGFASPLLTIAGAYADFRMLSDPGTPSGQPNLRPRR